MNFIREHLNIISILLMAAFVLAANEALYRLILVFRESFVSDLIHFARIIGWFLAVPWIFLCHRDVAIWIEVHILDDISKNN